LPLTDDINSLVEHIQTNKPDLVFNLIDTFRGQAFSQMNIMALLDLLGVCYTGSGSQAYGLSMDKALTKSILMSCKIPVPRFQVAYKNKIHLDAGLIYPLIVKPLYDGGSYGITNESVVYSSSAVEERVGYILNTYHQPSILEEYVEGREIHAAVLGDKSPIVMPLCEIDFQNFPNSLHRIRSFQSKWNINSFEYQNTALICPAPLPDEAEILIKKIAAESHKALGCRDYSRIDIRLDNDNKPYVLEVNTNPLISSNSSFIVSLQQSGRGYLDFISSLINSALERKGNLVY
jgi:D-alanine-D-alanine ligase